MNFCLEFYQFVPDWQTHEEYIIEMRIIDGAALHCLDSASYKITLRKGGWDYTPDVQLTSSRGVENVGTDVRHRF